MTNEIDNLKQKADNTSELTDLQNKMNIMEKEIIKLRRTAEVKIYCLHKIYQFY